MKILLATGIYPPDIGGPATYSALLARELPAKGIDVEVLSFGSVRRMPKLIRHAAYFVHALWRGRSADLIFAQDTVSVGLPAFFAAYVLGKAFVVRVPGDYAWEQASQSYGVSDSVEDFQKRRYVPAVERLRSIQRFVVGRADRVIAPSAYFAEIVRTWVAHPERVDHIYNGIDLSDVASAIVGISPKARALVSAGRLVAWKKFDTLIRAMKRLPQHSLEIIGDGPEEAALKKLVADTGLADRIDFSGRMDREELLKRLASAEVFALPSAFETFSFQTVEALAAGAPVVAARVGALPEIVDDGRNGILIRPDSEEELAAAIAKISGDPALRARMSASAREKAAKLSISACLDAVKSALSTAVSSETAPYRNRAFLGKLIRYLFSGGIAAVTNLVLLWLFTDVAHVWYLTSSILAFLLAFCVSFVLQKFFTFQDHGMKGIHGQAASYLFVAGANLIVNTVVIYLFVQYAHLNYLIAQIVTSILIAIESYVIYGMFIFKNDRPTS